MNYVVYRIQRHPASKMMVVDLNRLTPYHGTAEHEQPYRGRSLGQRRETQTKRNEGCTPSRPELDASGRAQLWGPIREDSHRR
jgi:hypothetical protein